MAGKYDFYFEDDFINEYYCKLYELKKLELQCEDMRNIIKNTMDKHAMFFTATESYNVILTSCYKPNQNFIDILKNTENKKFIKESCTMKDYKMITDKLDIRDDTEYLDFWYKRLQVTRK